MEQRSCVWIAVVTGLGGIAQQSRDHAGLCRHGSGAGRAEIMHVWIPSLAGLRYAVLHSGYCAGLEGTAQQNGDSACVDRWHSRPWAHGPAEIVNVCGSQGWLALRAHWR
jgi:hypothetical protein